MSVNAVGSVPPSVRATKLAEAKAMRGSKYLQSEVESVYGLVKEDVEAGRFVLFSGTPCQIAGLGAFLGFPNSYLSLICWRVD